MCTGVKQFIVFYIKTQTGLSVIKYWYTLMRHFYERFERNQNVSRLESVWNKTLSLCPFCWIKVKKDYC